jgi:hypothetical protein
MLPKGENPRRPPELRRLYAICSGIRAPSGTRNFAIVVGVEAP